MGYMTSQYRKVEPARLEQREVVRQPVLLQKATVRRHAAQPREALLADISVYGCRLITDATFKLGERLWIRLHGRNPVGATTVWTAKGLLGCRFDEALDRSLFRELTLSGH
jgi:hypothetical protein